MESKKRLDKLIKKSRADLYKPIAIAEILYRHRVNGLNIDNVDSYRRQSYGWMQDIIWQLHHKTTQLNSRYWDQLFDATILPPTQIQELAEFNNEHKGLIEIYIYAHVQSKYRALTYLRQNLETMPVDEFSLDVFLGFFESNAKYRGSVDKAYEIAVYALFNTVVRELKATITLSVDQSSMLLLQEFEDFARLVLGIDMQHLSIEKPARLFRIGTTNANDAGLDMWTNFGPAVQVKHISLQSQQMLEICNSVRADQLIVVCKTRDAKIIQTVIEQMGLAEKLRGIITKNDLEIWYDKCFQPQYSNILGRQLIDSIVEEMKLEFPLSVSESFDKFFTERNYSDKILQGDWIVKYAEAVLKSGS
ncbi:MAG: HaeII family restriction endonuclease [Planctomycetaceae bacterium]|jgi:type II restriction enzyme|nr:HaeII family restriction endonuclease [Planctomycetaceae bacterium]